MALSNGSILKLKEEVGNNGHFKALAGSNAVLDQADSIYTLTAPDGSTYVFETPPGGSGSPYVVTRRTWPNSERWTYRYYDDPQHVAYGKLQAVEDGYGRKLQFTYIDNFGEFDHLQLYRVGDHQAAGLAYGDTPSGRFVQFTYIEEYVDGIPKSPSPKALLSQVRDVRDEKWAYVYYGRASGEMDADKLNFLVIRKSPAVNGLAARSHLNSWPTRSSTDR